MREQVPDQIPIGKTWKDSSAFYLMSDRGLIQFDLDERLEYEAELERVKTRLKQGGESE